MADAVAPVEQPPLPECVVKGLSASVKYMVNNFLCDKHYSKVSGSLANRWDKFQSLTAAMKLMEQHGVQLSPEEEQRLSGMSETQMIEALVMKMPQQSKEQFQHFFLQLQLIVSTATRVRRALEDGRADVVEQAMDDAESTGISQYILKMSIVQAGSEVTNLKTQHAAWVKDAESKMSRLVHGAEDAAMAKERLKKAHNELSSFQASQNESIKKVLMNFASGSTTALLHGCYSSWHNYVKKMKIENAIYEEYRDQIEAAEQRLIDAKADQLKSVKGMIDKKHSGTVQGLIQEVFDAWRDDILEAKGNLASAAEVAALEAKLKAAADHQAQSAKKVLARCGAASEQGLRDMCFHEWCTFHQDYMKNKELEDAVKAEEKKIAEFMKSHSENAKGLLNNMHAATNTGLMHEVFQAWCEHYKEEKAIAEYAEVLNGQSSKLGAFGERNKKGAKSVMERAHEHGIIMLYLKIFGAWRLDTAIEKQVRLHTGKLDGKRAQLSDVREMFRSFAAQLESNISNVDSSRDLALGPPPNYKKTRGMSKNEGSVSLPDIHTKPGSDSTRPRSRDRSSRYQGSGR
jgi:hypothetical protein